MVTARDKSRWMHSARCTPCRPHIPGTSAKRKFPSARTPQMPSQSAVHKSAALLGSSHNLLTLISFNSPIYECPIWIVDALFISCRFNLRFRNFVNVSRRIATSKKTPKLVRMPTFKSCFGIYRLTIVDYSTAQTSDSILKTTESAQQGLMLICVRTPSSKSEYKDSIMSGADSSLYSVVGFVWNWWNNSHLTALWYIVQNFKKYFLPTFYRE